MENIYLDHDKVLGLLPDRAVNSHKGNFGKILLICGSRGYTGAPALAAMGSLRSGAGLVYLAVPESIYSIEAGKLLEPIVLPLDDRNGKLAGSAIKQIEEMLPKMDALLVGPGLGLSDDVSEVVCWLLNYYHGPVVIDADGINVLCRHKNVLRERKGITIITPHEGEFMRLSGTQITNRITDAKLLATELGIIVLLKGHETVVTDGMRCYINTTGNPGMAVGGCGDILAGIITSLLGQGLDPFNATCCGAWLHGKAGDICSAEIGQYGMLPSDMLNALPRLLK